MWLLLASLTAGSWAGAVFLRARPGPARFMRRTVAYSSSALAAMCLAYGQPWAPYWLGGTGVDAFGLDSLRGDRTGARPVETYYLALVAGYHLSGSIDLAGKHAEKMRRHVLQELALHHASTLALFGVVVVLAAHHLAILVILFSHAPDATFNAARALNSNHHSVPAPVSKFVAVVALCTWGCLRVGVMGGMLLRLGWLASLSSADLTAIDVRGHDDIRLPLRVLGLACLTSLFGLNLLWFARIIVGAVQIAGGTKYNDAEDIGRSAVAATHKLRDEKI